MSYVLPVSIYKQDIEPEYLERCLEEHRSLQNKLTELLAEPMMYQEILKYYQVKPSIVSFFGTMFRPEHIQYMPKFTTSIGIVNNDIIPNQIHEIPIVCNSDVFLFIRQDERMMMTPDGKYTKTKIAYYSDVHYVQRLRYTFYNKYVFTDIPGTYSYMRSFTSISYLYNQEVLYRLTIKKLTLQIGSTELYFDYAFSNSQEIRIPEFESNFIPGNSVKLCTINNLDEEVNISVIKIVPIFDKVPNRLSLECSQKNPKFIFIEFILDNKNVWKMLKVPDKHDPDVESVYTSESKFLDDISIQSAIGIEDPSEGKSEYRFAMRLRARTDPLTWSIDTSNIIDICTWQTQSQSRIAVLRSNMSIEIYNLLDTLNQLNFQMQEPIYNTYLIYNIGSHCCITFIHHDELAILVNGVLYRHYL